MINLWDLALHKEADAVRSEHEAPRGLVIFWQMLYDTLVYFFERRKKKRALRGTILDVDYGNLDPGAAGGCQRSSPTGGAA